MSYVCPVCHNDRNPPGAKFCMVCGTGFPLSNPPDPGEEKTDGAGPGENRAPHSGAVSVEGSVMNVDGKTGTVEASLNCAVIFQNSHEPRVNPCKVTVDTEADKVILSIPAEKIGVSLNFDEVLSIMAQAIVLFHQRHDGKGGGAHAE